MVRWNNKCFNGKDCEDESYKHLFEKLRNIENEIMHKKANKQVFVTALNYELRKRFPNASVIQIFYKPEIMCRIIINELDFMVLNETKETFDLKEIKIRPVTNDGDLGLELELIR